MVDMSLCDGARDYPQDKKQKRRMQNDIFSGDITTSNWRFRLIGRRLTYRIVNNIKEPFTTLA